MRFLAWLDETVTGRDVLAGDGAARAAAPRAVSEVEVDEVLTGTYRAAAAGFLEVTSHSCHDDVSHQNCLPGTARNEEIFARAPRGTAVVVMCRIRIASCTTRS